MVMFQCILCELNIFFDAIITKIPDRKMKWSMSFPIFFGVAILKKLNSHFKQISEQ